MNEFDELLQSEEPSKKKVLKSKNKKKHRKRKNKLKQVSCSSGV